jgi:hypothetical protein
MTFAYVVRLDCATPPGTVTEEATSGILRQVSALPQGPFDAQPQANQNHEREDSENLPGGLSACPEKCTDTECEAHNKEYAATKTDGINLLGLRRWRCMEHGLLLPRRSHEESMPFR